MIIDGVTGHCDFDKMIYTMSGGNEYKIEIRDGSVVHVRYSKSLYFFTLGHSAQAEYEEYMSKKIEEELLEDK